MSHRDHDPSELSTSSLEDRRALQRFPPGAPPLSPYNTVDVSDLGGGSGLSQQLPPADKYRLSFGIMVLLGVSVLLNWNTMITAYDYFHLVMDTDDFEFYFTLFFNIPCFLTNLAMIWYGQVIPLVSRVMWGHSMFLAILVALPIVGAAHHSGSLGKSATNALIYGLCAATGFVTGIIFPSITGLAALFPAKYMTATMSGVGFGGVIVGVIRIATRAALPTDAPGVRTGSMIYFIVGAVTMLSALLSFLVLRGLPFAKYHIRQSERAQQAAVDGTAKRLLDDGMGNNGNGNGNSSNNNKGDTIDDGDVDVVDVGMVDPTSSSIGDGRGSPSEAGGKATISEVYRKTWVVQTSISLSFFITIGLFPGVATLITSESESFSEWFKIIMVSIFLLFDWIGRSLPNTIMLFNHRNVWIPTVGRLIFVPLFIFCVKPRLFHNDAIPYAIMVAFALSNGYLCTSLMTFGPQMVQPHEMEIVGIITVFSLNGGILAGAAIGILFSHVL